MFKLEPGAGDEGKDLITFQGLNPEGKAIPMAAVFHGADTVRWIIKEMETAMDKYDVWRAKQIPPADAETRRIEITP